MQELHPESRRSRELAYFLLTLPLRGQLKKPDALPWGTDCHGGVSAGFAMAGYICEGSFQRSMIFLFFVVSDG